MAKAHSLAYANVSLLYGEEDLPHVVRRRIADLTMPLAEAAAGRFGWEDATTDWREITRAPDIELVDISTPNDTHAEIAIDAARHGKHVLCEKPLAHRLDAAAAMHQAVSAANVAHQVDFVYRKWPAMQHARRLVARGDLGHVRQFRACFFHDYANDPALPMTWRLQRSRAGAGSLGDIGSHLIDLARYLVGDIQRVMARTFTFRDRRPMRVDGTTSPTTPAGLVDVDDAAQVWLEFESGASGSLETSWMATGHKTDCWFELLGEEGSVVFSWLNPMELRFYSERDPSDVKGFRSIIIGPEHAGAEAFWPVAGQPLSWGDAFLISIRDLLASLAAGRPPDPSFLDGVRACEVVEAALASAESGLWTNVPRAV